MNQNHVSDYRMLDFHPSPTTPETKRFNNISPN